jgi:hypothetical protein
MLAPSSRRDASFSVLHFFPARHEYERILIIIKSFFALTLFLFRQNGGVGKSYQHGPFSIAYPKLAFQTADNVLCLLSFTCSKELRDDRNFLALRLGKGVSLQVWGTTVLLTE